MIAPGSKLGPYVIKRRIGDTSDQSSVYIAMHEETQHQVALRALHITTRGDIEAAIAACKAELEQITSVYVPNSVQIESYGHVADTIYIAMTVMSGGTLLSRMKQRAIGLSLKQKQNNPAAPQLPSFGEVLTLTERIASALEQLHDVDRVHGQLEPRSIMFDEQGAAHLADIGLTRLTKIIYDLDTTNSLNVTKYTPPELWNGERPGSSTDQYSLACIVYELLTGGAPFTDASIFGLMQAHTSSVVEPPHYVREGLPGDLAMVFWQALAKPTDRRFASVMAFYDALEAVLGDEPGEPTGFFTFPLKSIK